MVIGLEVHAQLLTRSKIFCECFNTFGADPNSNICPICTGQPGSLPVLNKKALELGVRAAIAISGNVAPKSIFARKNYFYPDLPKGYQISQFENPFCTQGTLKIRLKDGTEKTIGITRIHFEEDAGKSNHEAHGTLVDLNRAGVPLIEIVSEPDMRSSEEAGQYLRTLRNLLRFAEVCDGNMEQGNFRCDANISLRPKGQQKFGTKVELKNINSFKYVENAIEYEIVRQLQLIEQGEEIKQQTRGWNSANNTSELMREKEQAHDYRYFPEPDLKILQIAPAWVEQIRKSMPELPEPKFIRFKEQYGLSDYDAGVLTASKELADFYEVVVGATQSAKNAANWVMNELLGKLNAQSKEIEESPVSAKELAGLIQKIEKSEISGKIAKTVFEEMFETGKTSDIIIKERGFSQISDASQLQDAISRVLKDNPEQVAAYRAGKTKLLGFFVGQVMKETKGQANPQLLNELLVKALQ